MVNEMVLQTSREECPHTRNNQCKCTKGMWGEKTEAARGAGAQGARGRRVKCLLGCCQETDWGSIVGWVRSP